MDTVGLSIPLGILCSVLGLLLYWTEEKRARLSQALQAQSFETDKLRESCQRLRVLLVEKDEEIEALFEKLTDSDAGNAVDHIFSWLPTSKAGPDN